MRLTYVVQIIDTILGSTVNKNWDGLRDCLKRKGIFTLTACNFCISTLIMQLKNDNLCDQIVCGVGRASNWQITRPLIVMLIIEGSRERGGVRLVGPHANCQPWTK